MYPESSVARESYIYDVLTLIALLAIWTCATRKLADSNAVDIARSAGKVLDYGFRVSLACLRGHGEPWNSSIE